MANTLGQSPWSDLTVNYAHCWDQIYKGIGEQGPYYEVVYYIEGSWALADQVVNELMGYAQRQGETTYMAGPHQYPLDPTGRSLCYSARAMGVGTALLNNPGYPQYDTGFFVEAKYRVPPFPQYETDDPTGSEGIDAGTRILWASQELDFESESILLEKSQYKYLSDGKKTGVPVKINFGVTVMDITFHRVPYMPTALIRSARCTVNNATFLGSPTGCVMFMGARTHKEIYLPGAGQPPVGTISTSSGGAFTRSVQAIFHERNVDWNKIYRNDTLAWDTIQDSTGHKPYAATNLSLIIQALGRTF